DRSLARYFETFATSLPAVQGVAHKLGGSVNDAYVTGLAGALGRYHERFDSAVDELRLAMPVSTPDQGDPAANRFVPARLLLPLRRAAPRGQPRPAGRHPGRRVQARRPGLIRSPARRRLTLHHASGPRDLRLTTTSRSGRRPRSRRATRRSPGHAIGCACTRS